MVTQKKTINWNRMNAKQVVVLLSTEIQFMEVTIWLLELVLRMQSVRHSGTTRNMDLVSFVAAKIERKTNMVGNSADCCQVCYCLR